MPDLLTVLHAIDRIKGRSCGACACYVPIDPTGRAINDPRMPADDADGCDDFSPLTTRQAKVAR
jgi:hypothetical protein